MPSNIEISGESPFDTAASYPFITPRSTSLNPLCYLIASSLPPRISRRTEDPLRRIRGPKEEAKRGLRGKSAISHAFCQRPSQDLSNGVTFPGNQAGVDSRFAVSVTAQRVSHRIFGSANPEDLSRAATDNQTIFLKI